MTQDNLIHKYTNEVVTNGLKVMEEQIGFFLNPKPDNISDEEWHRLIKLLIRVEFEFKNNPEVPTIVKINSD